MVYYNPKSIFDISDNVIRYMTNDNQIIKTNSYGIENGETKCSIKSNIYYSNKHYGEIILDKDVTRLSAAGSSYSGVFTVCNNLESIILPKSITYIVQWTFMNSNNLRSVFFLSTTPPFLYDNFRFIDSSISNIIVPDASIDSYKSKMSTDYTILPLSQFNF